MILIIRVRIRVKITILIKFCKNTVISKRKSFILISINNNATIYRVKFAYLKKAMSIFWKISLKAYCLSDHWHLKNCFLINSKANFKINKYVTKHGNYIKMVKIPTNIYPKKLKDNVWMKILSLKINI